MNFLAHFQATVSMTGCGVYVMTGCYVCTAACCAAIKA